MTAQSRTASCPRQFEVEALREGRVTGAEVNHFRSHIRSCSVCAGEMQALEGLAEALRSLPSLQPLDALHVRRERMRLLAAFDASLMTAPSKRGFKPWFMAVASLVMLLAAGWLLRRPGRSTGGPPSSLVAVDVQAAATTKWTRRAENQLETITLESGTLSISVDHRLAHRALRVMLPDGELEDVGTTFSVSAVADHTTQVTVQDGSIILRLRHQPAITLAAGDSWIPTAPPAHTPEEPPVATVHKAKHARVAASTASIAPQAGVAVSASSSPRAGIAVPGPADPAADFRTAMSAFTSGDNVRASNLFGAFLSQHPDDARAEDVAYLRVLALQRAGNSSGMDDAAVDYLKRYPHGFRNAEVRSLMSSPSRR
jgi:ferric-dicitrate binding protein FerR (iron transport regulator)